MTMANQKVLLQNEGVSKLRVPLRVLCSQSSKTRLFILLVREFKNLVHALVHDRRKQIKIGPFID